MPQTPELKAAKRTITGRQVKKLRRQGQVVANLFGPDIVSQALSVELKEFDKMYDEVGETGVISLLVDGQTKPHPVLIHHLQTDPKTDEILHVDFLKVDLTKKITANIPLELIGESPAVDQGGVLVLAQNEIEVEALPNDLPDNVEVNVSKLAKIGDSILVKDLSVASTVTILTDPESTIVTIQEQAVEEEPEPVVTEAEVGEGDVDEAGTTDTSEAESTENSPKT